MENAVYWKGRQVGIECAGRILWFSSAPPEAVSAYGASGTERADSNVIVEDAAVARNLGLTARCDRLDFGE
jgi:phage terminase large subunit-like protein